MKRMILCECGEFIDGCTFKDYIPTSSNPSTPTIGHQICGLLFNFIDDKLPKRYSSRVELKGIAFKFAEKNDMDQTTIGDYLLEVDRLKSLGNLCDMDILIAAYKTIQEKNSDDACANGEIVHGA
ncbi:Uncharacterised protein [uncultured archaeon]|nr:Uncharacterised protein [uncultured archaeon]